MPATVPTRMMTSPSSLNHCVGICFSSSISPTIAIVGVGSTTDVDATPPSRSPCGNSGDEGVATLSLYNETFPPVTGVPNARQASATPSTASRNCQKFSGLYGLPKRLNNGLHGGHRYFLNQNLIRDICAIRGCLPGFARI